jgi:UDP-N-acetylmuramyl pentapeptide phosphotransferase/UDP-N-acetylglucosamine-1-phosphate transferase
MRVFRATYDWMRERRTAIKFYYHLLGCFHFIFWWVVFFAVLILFTGGWYDDFFKECKQGAFSGFTMFFVIFSGLASFVKTRDKITNRREKVSL